MKKVLCIIAAALTVCAFSGCDSSSSSKAASEASAFSSRAESAGDNIAEGMSDAASFITSRTESMIENGQISDGDGFIGNEEESENN